MKRKDFSDVDRRYLAQQRGRVCRAVGQAHDRMIDAGVDPSETMDEMVAWLLDRVREAEADNGLGEAA